MVFFFFFFFKKILYVFYFFLGTVELRKNERIPFMFLLSKKTIGDKLDISFVRKSEKITVKDIEISHIPRLIPRLLSESTASYFVCGGLVFVRVSVPLFQEIYQDKWKQKVRLELLQHYYNDSPLSLDHQLITISQVLSSNINHGKKNRI